MQATLAVVVWAAMLVFAATWGLIWVGVTSEPLTFGSMAALALSTGAYLLGGAVMPGWGRGLWRTGKAGVLPVGASPVRVEMGRLVFLGAGIWFTAGGLAVVVAGVRRVVLGAVEPLLPPGVLVVMLGALAVGLAVFLVGLHLDQRRLAAAREWDDARQRADLHP